MPDSTVEEMGLFKLFQEKDVRGLIAFFAKEKFSIEDDIRAIELAHRKELERDLLTEKVVGLLKDILTSAKEMEARYRTKWHREDDAEFREYLHRTHHATRRLSTIVELAAKGNAMLLARMQRVLKRIEDYGAHRGGVSKEIQNVVDITSNQIAWREKTRELLTRVKEGLDDISRVAEDDPRHKDNAAKYDILRGLQRQLYAIIQGELDIDDATVNLEEIEEHEDALLDALEDRYFRSQKATTDTALNARRQLIARQRDQLIALVQSVNLLMVPVGFAAMRYPRVLRPFAQQDTAELKRMRQEHADAIASGTVSIPTGKGYSLEGTYFRREGCGKAIVILHELVHGRFHQLPDALSFNEEYNVLLFDSAGHFGSGGHCGLGYEEAEDLAAVLDWLIDVQKNSVIGVYGVSLGGGAAVGCIARYPRQELVKATVIQAAFASRREVIDEWSRGTYKMPDGALKKALLWMVDNQYKDREDYAPRDLIGAIRCPILIIHDIEDPWTQFHHSEELARNVTSPLKTYFRHGTEHYYTGNKIKRYIVFQFLKEHLGPGIVK